MKKMLSPMPSANEDDLILAPSSWRHFDENDRTALSTNITAIALYGFDEPEISFFILLWWYRSRPAIIEVMMKSIPHE